VSTDREQDGEVAPEAQLRNEWGRKVVTPDVDEDEHLDDGAGLTNPVGSAGPTEVCIPQFPRHAPSRRPENAKTAGLPRGVHAGQRR
jgi:hypothetical protein